MNDDERWNRLQRRAKLGLITRDEALSCGITSGALRRRVARGHLQRVSARVFRFAGTTETWDQRALAALWLLGPQSALSHQSAASILGIQQGRPSIIDVTVPRESVSSQRLESLSERVRVHRSRTSFAVKQAGHFQVTSWART
jgi:predicted transcriptional regulator of viral defense system